MWRKHDIRDGSSGAARVSGGRPEVGSREAGEAASWWVLKRVRRLAAAREPHRAGENVESTLQPLHVGDRGGGYELRVTVWGPDNFVKTLQGRQVAADVAGAGLGGLT